MAIYGDGKHDNGRIAHPKGKRPDLAAKLKESTIAGIVEEANSNPYAKRLTQPSARAKWVQDEHDAMLAIYEEGIDGYNISKDVQWGVTKWVIIKKTQ